MCKLCKSCVFPHVKHGNTHDTFSEIWRPGPVLTLHIIHHIWNKIIFLETKRLGKYNTVNILNSKNRTSHVRYHTFMGVTWVLQGWYRGCYQGITWELQGCYRGDTWVLQGVLRGVLQRVLQACYRCATGVLQWCYRYVTVLALSQYFPVLSRYITGTF